MAKTYDSRKASVGRSRRPPRADDGERCAQESLHPIVAILDERAEALNALGKHYRADQEARGQIENALKILTDCRHMIMAKACPPGYYLPSVKTTRPTPRKRRKT